ncbi:(2Fe-2S)-binding protein [Gordonia sp. L191]|uniref:(2Fe-2S)-binding protein n=1 Tax=Gordonia TaxID=2053 RepID=UPI001AD7DAB2|nr:MULTISPECIES: (2Fe-2S)-binding protein [Gordonia]QTI71168.1 (2Fe-2S)-binding protein [Gordonia polyisoprenivorans]WHU45396.1 (2Fe-2S)-binding protein [Gordonia sp. L191]
MFVCICRAVTEDEVHEHCTAGARTVDAISDRCGAGEGCGTCLERLAQIVSERTSVTTAA